MKKLTALLLSFVMCALLVQPALAAAPLDGYPGIDELEANDTIPNPFQFFDPSNDPTGDGYVSSVEEWSARREEIKDLVQHYWLGYQWPTASEDVTGGIVARTVDNDAEFGGFHGWWTTVFNLNDVFTGLVEAIQTDGVTVDGTTYGPEADAEAAKALAIEAWNAGYSIHYPEQFYAPEGDAVFTDVTGPISEDSIPQKTKVIYPSIVRIKNPETGVEAEFDIVVSAPTPEQKEAAWGSADALVPFVIDIGGSSAFSAENLNPQGYALITFTATEIYPDDSNAADGISREGVYTTLYPYDADQYEYASGALMSWAWGVSQILNALGNQAIGEDITYGQLMGLDPTRTVVTGHSRYGKAAMLAAAFDDRISICCPSEPGGSGIQSNRYKVEGKIFNWNTSYYPKADRVYGKTETPTVSYGAGNSWFPETAEMFVNKDNQIPFDSDEIIALVAPRPFFVVSGMDTHWLGNEGGVASVQAAAEVYDYIGTTEIEKNNIAIRCRQSDHVFYPQDFCFALAIMDREFKQGDDDTLLHVQDLFPEGENYSSMSYPAADYEYVSNLNSHPYEISSYYMPWSSAGKYVLWTAQDNFLTNHDVTITAHSDAPDVDLYTPDGTKLDAASAADGVFTFQLSAEDTVYGRYELRTAGEEKENRSVYFSAISLSDALRHGTTKGDEGEENRVLGFSSRLANTADNPPEVYINGQRTTMSFTAARVKPEETTLMSYGIQFHDHLFVRIAENGWDETKTFQVKNLQFVTLPDYTFEFSMADIYASAEDSGKEGAANFTKAISWPVERYNNGDAGVWPQIPNTLEERQTLASGGDVTRPEGPEPWTTGFGAKITSSVAQVDGGNLVITVTFSEPLNTGEYAFGLDVASRWQSAWNEAGNAISITIRPADLTAGAEKANLMFFRLMDQEGNLISGPIELPLDLPAVPQESAKNIGLLDSNSAGEYLNSYTGSAGSVTRGEMAEILYHLLSSEAMAEYGSANDIFSDVSGSDSVGAVISTLYAAGVVNGYADGTFRPDNHITRAELAAILSVLSGETSAEIGVFAGISGHWAEDAICAAAAQGWLAGYPDGTFRPDQETTISEVLGALKQMLVVG